MLTRRSVCVVMDEGYLLEAPDSTPGRRHPLLVFRLTTAATSDENPTTPKTNSTPREMTMTEIEQRLATLEAAVRRLSDVAELFLLLDNRSGS
jgi:hypothetical protein